MPLPTADGKRGRVMDGLISRQAAIEVIDAVFPVDPMKSEYAQGIACGAALAKTYVEQLPSAQPEQRWVPCSERLPNKFGEMIVTFVPAAGTLWTRVIIAHYTNLMGIAKPCFWIGNVGKNDFANITSQVVAWMPLPEPYREVEE